MKKYKDYIMESLLNLSSEYIFYYRGRYVIDTKHATERKIQRNQITQQEVETLYKRMIDDMLKKNESYQNTDGHYLFFSKSLNQGIVIHYRHDGKKKERKERDFIIITFLPRGNSYPQQNTKKVVLENYENNDYFSEEFVNYINDIISEKNTILQEQIEEKYNGMYDVEISEDEKIKFYFVEGKLWDLVDYELIEIE